MGTELYYIILSNGTSLFQEGHACCIGEKISDNKNKGGGIFYI